MTQIRSGRRCPSATASKQAKADQARHPQGDARQRDARRRLRAQQATIQDEIDDLFAELDESEIAVPPDLRQRIVKAIKADSARSWDSALRDIAGETTPEDAP